MTADNFPESEYLLCYYRMDEGSEAKELIDISEKKLNGDLVCEREDMWGEELGLGEPLDHEDRWGVKAIPNRSLKVDKDNYIQIKANEKLHIMASTFTIEMWVKIENTKEENYLLETSCKALRIYIKGNNVVIVNEQKSVEIECKTIIEEDLWTHIAIVWHSSALRPICIYLNGVLNGSSKELIANTRWVNEDINLCKFKGEVTEIRIWGTNLNEKIINENRKVPLAILASHKSMFQFIIKKQTSKPAVFSKKSLLARPPLSGFIPISQRHNSLVPPAKLKLPENHTTSESSPGNECETPNPFTSNNKVEAFEDKTSVEQQVINRSSAPFKPQDIILNERASKQRSLLPPRLKPSAIRNSEAVLKNSKVSVNEEVKIDSHRKLEEEKMIEMSFEKNMTVIEVSNRNSDIFMANTSKVRSSLGKPLSTVCAIDTKSNILSDIVGYLFVGNLKATIKTIEEYLKKLTKKLDVKERKVLGEVIRYKFIVKVLTSIHQLRKNEDKKSARRAADLANVAVFLRVNRKLKFNLYKLAVTLI